MNLETNLFFFFNNLAGKSINLDAIIIFFAEYFLYFLIGFFILFLILSPIPKKEKIYILITTILILADNLVITGIIRYFYHRPRPFLALPCQNLITENSYSFPSRHATFSFALAMIVYLFNKKWGIGFFIAAIVISLSRIAAGVHYPSDILGGMIIGIAISWIIFHLSKKYTTKFIKKSANK